MNNNKNSGIAGMGYYIALILCAVAIGITGYWYYRNETQVQEVSVQETQDDLIGPMSLQDVPAIATTEPQQGTAATTPQKKDGATTPTPATPSAPSTPKESQEPVRKELKTVSPVGGAEVYGYSMEALSYNQTTRDWRVHNGVDLAAEDGAPVAAAADGTVYTTYEDDTLGHTVVIRHQDGYTTRYSSLTENLAVKPGDTVTAGQTIGYAGATAIVEVTLGTHVHFSVTHNDEPMDPAAFLALG